LNKTERSEVRDRPEKTTKPGNGDRRPFGKDLEVEGLRRELAELRAREKRALAEAAEARERLSQLSAASRSFASSMRVRSLERERFKRRVAAQYAIGRVLAEAKDLDEAGPEIFTILAEELGWELGVLWKMDVGAKVLRYGGGWRRPGGPSDEFEEACHHTSFARGSRLPGRVWDRGEPAWVENFATGESSREDAAMAEGLRTALAFPVRTRNRVVAVFELFSREDAPPDEDLIRTAALVGDQIGQFVERRRAEDERTLSLAREREARRETSAILESITDAFIALDRGWRFTYLNRAAKELVPAFGGDPERLLGKVLWEELPTLEDTKFGERLLHTAREGEATEYEEFYPELGKWFHGRIYPSKGGISGYFENITERKRAEEERDRLLAREWVARAEVAERERISRELHDRVAHSMGVAHQSLQLYEVFRENQPSQAAAKLALAKEMTKAALEATRNLSMELRRSEAEEGLVPALEDLLKVTFPESVGTGLDARGDESHIPPHVRGQLFAILREAVRNAARHSGASNVRVALDVTQEAAACSVEDDGQGILAQENAKGYDNGVGLRSMRERATLLGGDFRLSSRSGEGTKVEVTVPLSGGA
jgi:PAS domain S-box-containing protein